MRHFVCGDIHGCYNQLHAKLNELGFDKSRDQLHALGDLVDRGPDNVECMRLLEEPWFDSILGNHEHMLMMYHAGVDRWNYIPNGGGWFVDLPKGTQDEMFAKASQLPYTRMIVTPTKRKVGLVHADVLGNDWDTFQKQCAHNHADARHHAIWARARVYMENPPPVHGVDAIYFGHTPRKVPQRVGMFNWIDTGCFATGVITVEELI